MDSKGQKLAGEGNSRGMGRFAVIELVAMAIMLGIVVTVVTAGYQGMKADGRHRLASGVFAALRGSNSLLYVK